MQRLLARKSVEQMRAEHAGGGLQKSLSASSLVLLGVGCIVGTGIFVLTGRAAAQFAGPAIMISFVITGAMCALIALCYAELAAALPASGSAYSYSYASLGELAAWIMALLLLLEYAVAAAAVAVAWSAYVASLLHDLGIDIPVALRAAPGVPVRDFVSNDIVGVGVVNLPALLVVPAATALLVTGVSRSARANNVLVFVKVSVVVAFIVVGAFFVDPQLWTPLIPPQSPPHPLGAQASWWEQIGSALWDVLSGEGTARFGVPGIIMGATAGFFAYLGFEVVATAGAESKNPARDMPIGILGSLSVCTVLYILTAVVLVGIIPYAQLDDPAPIAKAVNRIGLPWFAALIKVGAIAGLSSVMLVTIYAQTRIFYAVARDGLLPGAFARVHPRFRTPWINTILVGAFICVVAGFVGIDALTNLISVGTLAAFAIVSVAVIQLRITHPALHRPFRTPFFPATPLLGVLMCVFMLAALFSHALTRNFFLLYMAVGVAMYFMYGLRNSKLGRATTRGDTDVP